MMISEECIKGFYLEWALFWNQSNEQSTINYEFYGHIFIKVQRILYTSVTFYFIYLLR